MKYIEGPIGRIRQYFAEQDRQAKEAYCLRFESVEAIQAFPYHRPNCPKVGPLKRVVDRYSSLIGAGWGGGIPYVYIQCVECEGSERDVVQR